MRCSKSCRLRWTNYLRPGIKRGNFTDQEEKLIVHLQALLGNRYRENLEQACCFFGGHGLAARLCCVSSEAHGRVVVLV